MWLGVTFRVYPMCVSLKAPNFMGNPNMYARHENFITPDLLHPALQTCLLEPDPPGGKAFFAKTPRMCVQNDQCDKGILFRDVSWGTQDPSPAAPSPTTSPHPPFRGPTRLGGVAVGGCPWAHRMSSTSSSTSTRTSTGISNSNKQQQQQLQHRISELFWEQLRPTASGSTSVCPACALTSPFPTSNIGAKISTGKRAVLAQTLGGGGGHLA